MGQKNIFTSFLKRKKKDLLLYFALAVSSLIVFVAIYGLDIINPTYDDWLLSGNDLTQHYLGWLAYRNSDWLFPIGMTNNLAYPQESSIIFTDSIPLFAVFFKLLSPLLPSTFQYSGLWCALCFILQTFFVAKILLVRSKNLVFVYFSSLMFLFVPVLHQRMFMHASLTGQWLLLMALYPLMNFQKFKENPRTSIIYWSFCGFLSSCVHIYLLVMCGLILAAYILISLIERKGIKGVLLSLLGFLLVAFLSILFLGGFAEGAATGYSGLGFYSSNLNTLYNPQGYSAFLPDLPLAKKGQYEGFGYLGLGVLLEIAICFVLLILNYKKRGISGWIKAHKAFVIAVALLFLVALLVALSPTITLDSLILFSVPMPDFLISAGSIFRSSGRFIWINIYLIMLLSAIAIDRLLDKKSMYAIVISFILLFAQVCDTRPLLEEKQQVYSEIKTYKEDPNNALFDSLDEMDDVEHIVLVDPLEEKKVLSIAKWALENDCTLNRFYFAQAAYSSQDDSIKDAIESGEPDFSFIFEDQESLSKYNAKDYLEIEQVDGLFLGKPKTEA